MHNNVVFFPVIWDCFPQVTDYGYRLVPLMFILASLLDNMRCFVVGIGEWEELVWGGERSGKGRVERKNPPYPKIGGVEGLGFRLHYRSYLGNVAIAVADAVLLQDGVQNRAINFLLVL